MHEVSGGCYCGNIRIHAALSQPLISYRPRACDCGFCGKHAAAYISDSAGRLRIQIGVEDEVNRFRQGSNTAQMMLCRICGVLVGALFDDSGRLFGTLNSRALDSCGSFGPQQSVSPQSLSAEQKVQRWRELWFADVLLQSSSVRA